MNLEQALRIALQYEHKVRDHYAKGAEAIQDPSGKRVFETLAKEEQGHVDYLQHCLEQWSREGRVTVQTLKSVLPQGTEWMTRAKKNLSRPASRSLTLGKEVELLKTALELENKTSGFYQELVSQLPPADQPLFAKFLDIEQGHVSIVQAELDAVQGLGYWFDMPEFALEAG